MKHEYSECCDITEVHEDRVRESEAHMPDDETLFDLAELFKIFGDSTRIKILFLLRGTELCVCDISEALGMTQSAVSHQLNILKRSKLVKNRREGKSIFYSLDDDHVSAILSLGIDHVSE